MQLLEGSGGVFEVAKDGVLVSAVTASSPAAAAGLRAGDVITTVDGQTVTSRADLTRRLREAAEDGAVTVGIVRDRKETTLQAKVEAQPGRGQLRSRRRL